MSISGLNIRMKGVMKIYSFRHYLFCSEYLGNDHTDVAFLYCCMGQCCIESKRLAEAKEFLQKADDIYKYVPGKSHPFYRNQFQPLLSSV